MAGKDSFNILVYFYREYVFIFHLPGFIEVTGIWQVSPVYSGRQWHFTADTPT